MESYSTFMDWKTNTIKLLILANFIYRFNALLIKSQASSFVDTDKLIEVYWKSKKPKVANMTLKIKDVEDFKAYQMWH